VHEYLDLTEAAEQHHGDGHAGRATAGRAREADLGAYGDGWSHQPDSGAPGTPREWRHRGEARHRPARFERTVDREHNQGRWPRSRPSRPKAKVA